jgi:carbon storage regulator CsrA
MLALSRGEGQSIIINGTIEVKIVKWTRSSVRLAIEAPRDVTIDRDEVWRKMHPDLPTPLDQAQAIRSSGGLSGQKSGTSIEVAHSDESARAEASGADSLE